MEYEGYSFPDDLKYEKNHFWAKVDGDVVVMGATEFITKQAGEITFVDVPEEGDEVTQGKPFGSIESGKWVGRIYAVVSGEVAEVNELLEDEPEKMNEEPYGEAWICRIIPSNLEEDMAALMSAGEDLTGFIAAEIKRVEEQSK
ncbi:glycine cleavage system protein GcvH [Thermodesulfobacteriota bacterium]